MKNLRVFVTVTLLAVVTAGCGISYRSEFLKRAEGKGYTREQQLAALYYSYRYFGMENDDGTFDILYSRLPKKEVTEQLDRFLADLADLLGYKNEGWNRYLRTFGLREHFEHQEEVFEAIRARIRMAELYDVFGELMGNRSRYSVELDKFGYDHSRGYDPSIFQISNLRSKFPFRSTVIDEAKAKGILEEIERSTLVRYRRFDHKEPDPNFPNDPNKFIWKSRRYSFEVIKYKIVVDGEKPTDNHGNYIEVFRLVNGQRESLPAIQAFLDGKGKLAVAVIDVDSESQGFGFGLPDFVERLSERNLVSSDMVDRLFPEDKKSRRIEPQRPPIRVEIARVGEEINVWETSTDSDGWMVPLSYRLKPRRDNYNVRLQFERRSGITENSDNNHRKVEYIVKEWTSGNRYRPSTGTVLEYFRPKSPYSNEVVSARVFHLQDTKRVRFEFPDGEERTGRVTPTRNVFIGETPRMIAYTLGEKRWLIRDEDGDGKYEERKQISPELEDETGVYSSRRR